METWRIKPALLTAQYFGDLRLQFRPESALQLHFAVNDGGDVQGTAFWSEEF